jgi:hypothetical protein
MGPLADHVGPTNRPQNPRKIIDRALNPVHFPAVDPGGFASTSDFAKAIAPHVASGG